MSTATGGAALVGRADELSRLRACCEAVAGGSGALVLLDGEAGAGKTRLLAEVVKAPFLPRGFAAAVAGALDYAPAPYAPIRDLIVALDRRFPKVLAGRADLAAALAPVLDFRPQEAAADAGEQRRVLDSVVQAVGLFAAQAPIVLALEDVHWIDRASADVLVHLARSIEAMRAVLFVSFRPLEAREAENSQYLLAQLSRTASLALSIKPLSTTDAMLLIEDAAPVQLPLEIRREICRLAQGNPLLLLEFAKVASEDPGALRRSLPITLKALVAERLANFSDVDVDVLRVAAVMGEFDPPLLAEISGVTPQHVAAMLRKARNASIVGEPREPGAPFVFRHALIRHAITEDLLAYEAEDLHRRIAERLEREPQSTRLFMRLAHHYHHAKCSEKSQHYNALAAEEALSVFAYSDAAELLERGIDGRSLDDATYSLYGKLAEAYLYAQRPADSVRITQELFDFAVARGRLREAATFGFELSRRRYQLLDDEGSIETIRRAIAVADACADPDIAFDLHATHAWYLAQLRRVDEAAQALAQAEPLRPHGAPHGLVRYYEARGVRSVHAGERETYREDLDEALRIAQGEGVRFYIRRLDTALAIAMASNLDDTEYALEMCRRMWDAAATQPMHTVAPMLSTTALVALLVGELETAKHIIAASLQSAEEAPLIHFNIARAGIPLAIHLDDPLLLRRCSRPRLLENAFASNTENVFGPVAAAVAQHLRVQNRTSEAVALVTHTIKRLATLANNIPIAVEAARLGAQEALERAMPMLDAMRNASRSADAGRHLASAYVSNGQERRQHAERAAELFHAIGWVFYEAEALEMAAKPEQALAIYRRCGSIANVRRLESTQKARAAAGLSKREWEVAQLVAQGRSNRAIAGELYLSERTVENHIASIFNKLSLRSRAEIATYVAREGAKAEEQR